MAPAFGDEPPGVRDASDMWDNLSDNLAASEDTFLARRSVPSMPRRLGRRVDLPVGDSCFRRPAARRLCPPPFFLPPSRR